MSNYTHIDTLEQGGRKYYKRDPFTSQHMTGGRSSISFGIFRSVDLFRRRRGCYVTTFPQRAGFFLGKMATVTTGKRKKWPPFVEYGQCTQLKTVFSSQSWVVYGGMYVVGLGFVFIGRFGTVLCRVIINQAPPCIFIVSSLFRSDDVIYIVLAPLTTEH